MLDAGMAEFQAEMLARPRPPRRASTRRSGEIDNSSAPGAAALARRIKGFWADAGFDITVRSSAPAARAKRRFMAFAAV
jgi:hypothetical protein